MEFGVQIFGALKECKQDPDGFFRSLAQAGYRQIEPCVLFDDPEQMLIHARQSGNEFLMNLANSIWKPEELPGYIKLMEKYGLTLSSVHVFTEDMNRSAERMIETARQNHITAYVVNCNQQTVATEYQSFAQECIKLAKKLKPHGVELWLHNNGAEIKAKTEYNGKTVPVLTAILELCQEAGVGVQVDVGWVLFGGVDPVQYLSEVGPYLRSVHFKDLKKDFAQRTDGDIFACLGDGALKVKEVMYNIPSNQNITVLVDQDASEGDILEDLHRSCQVLKGARKLTSFLEIYDLVTEKRSVVFQTEKHIEAPNWTQDGRYIIYNSEGLIWQYELSTGEHKKIDSKEIVACNNDHVLSPDGKEIAVSSMAPGTDLKKEGYNSYIYILPISGGEPRKVTPNTPSFLHGWSPDGKTLAYCAMRDGDRGDIYTIGVEGGEETRLTVTDGLSDGPEYSPDGRHLWYNSVRSGLMQIWRMDANGDNQLRITQDERNNWFAHVSPDSQKVIYVSYHKQDVEPGDHPANKNVELHLMNYDGSDNRVIVELFGGQGTLNVNSWAPDSNQFAFVSYQLN